MKLRAFIKWLVPAALALAATAAHADIDPNFTIYTFGDVDVFRAALTGVAMIFDGSTNFFVSNGASGAGLGGLAALGMLIGLGSTLFRGVAQGKIELGGWIITIVFFSVMFVPKFSVNIEDYNGGAIAKVDGVPLGVALPAGLVSGLAKEMNTVMGTAFSTVQGYPSGIMTPEAITSPLRLLHSLNYGAPLMPVQDNGTGAMIVDNVANTLAYCAAGRTISDVFYATNLAKDPLTTVLTDAGNSPGLAMHQSSVGTPAALTTCAYASSDTIAEISAFSSSSALTTLLTAAAAKSDATPMMFGATSVTPTPVDLSVVENSLTLLSLQAPGASVSANYINNLILAPWASAALACGAVSGNPTDWAKVDNALCAPFKAAVAQSAEDSAAAGASFQRVMYTGMNVLFFVWICLSPVVGLVMLMMDVRGLKIGGSYLLFGAWAVSWYVGATIINFYMLKQIQYSLMMFSSSGIGGLTVKSLADFQDVLRMKLATAGDMMASVPLLMMSIMSGSVYGLVQLAGKSPADKYDEKVDAPSATGSAPLYQRSGLDKGIDYETGATGRAGAYLDAPVIKTGVDMQNALSSAQTQTHKLASQLSESQHKVVQDVFGHNWSGEQARTIASGLKSSGANDLASLFDIKQQLQTEVASGNSVATRFSYGLNASLGGGVGGFGAKAQMSLEQAQELKFTEAQRAAYNNAVSGSSQFNSSLSNDISGLTTDKFGEAGSMVDQVTNSSDWNKTEQISDEYADAKKREQSAATSLGVSQDISTVKLAGLINQKPQSPLAMAINSQADKFMSDPGFSSAVNSIYAADKRTSLADYSNDAVMTTAKLQALSMMSGQPGNEKMFDAYSETVRSVQGYMPNIAAADSSKLVAPDVARAGAAGTQATGAGPSTERIAAGGKAIIHNEGKKTSTENRIREVLDHKAVQDIVVAGNRAAHLQQQQTTPTPGITNSGVLGATPPNFKNPL